MKMERHISYKPGVPIWAANWNGIRMKKSWECPCHGSRFDYMGHVIDNPTMEDLKYDSITEYE